jgi:hypothetical protein
VSSIHPAIVTQEQARPLPRLILLCLCLAWVLPGVLGRDPWRGAELSAYGLMAAMAEGRTSWWAPTLGGVGVDAALLPHWLGALAIAALSPGVDPVIAARLPFSLILAATLVLVWQASYRLACSEAARPLPLAFGGEAEPQDYARTLGDGAVLAMIGTLGLLQLGHETTPELVQLLATSVLLWAVASAGWRPIRARTAVLVSLPLLAAGGAPTLSLAFGLVTALICLRSTTPRHRALAPWVLTATLASALMAFVLGIWAWRWDPPSAADDILTLARQWAWFMWPAWLLAAWAVWQWRGHVLRRHLALPMGISLCALAGNVVAGGSDRILLLAIPGLAILSAFALPTMRRAIAAAVDWFSICFFSVCALFIWFMYVAMHTGFPARPAANIAKLAVGFEADFSWSALAVGAAAATAWLALVRWRTRRHRPELWKSLILPAGGVATCWILLMTLWLPLLDYGRSARPVVDALRPLVGSARCVAGSGLSASWTAAFESLGGWRVDAQDGASQQSACPILLQISRQTMAAPAAGWTLVGTVRRPTEQDEIFSVYRR